MSQKKYLLKIETNREKLSDRSEEVDLSDKEVLDNISHLVADIKDTLRVHDNMIALSAPQLGSKVRVFCIKFADNDIRTFVNPIITKIEGKYLSIEPCVTLDNKEFMVQRPERILLGYQTPTGQFKSDIEFKSPVSGIIDQMIDTLDGILFFKYEQQGIEIDDEYYKASPEEKEELHKWYKEEYLPRKLDELKALEDDPEIKKMTDAVSFMTKLANNEISLSKVTVNKDKLPKRQK